MTRTEHIAKLTKYLRKLPQKDYEEALEYFMEYFEEAGPEMSSGYCRIGYT